MTKTLQTDAQRRADRRAALQEARDIAKHKLHMAQVRLDPVGAARRSKAAWARRRRELLDPNWCNPTLFPTYSGQSILQYIRTFQALNGKLSNTSHLDFVNLRGERFL